MRLLFIGDIVGRPGRQCLKILLPGLTERLSPDCIIANGENAAGGAGITLAVYRELRELGIDVITGGNHIWDNREVFRFIEDEPYLLRPANYPLDDTPGRGSCIFKTSRGTRIGILNLMGRLFMQPLLDCPFQRAVLEIEQLRKETPVIVVDFHGEATAEKQALAWHLDGRVSAVIGTHTHVLTADERILPQGTAYITDAGMTGLYDSILGVDRHGALQKFLTGLPQRFKISTGAAQLNGVLLEIDERSGKASSIKRIREVIEKGDY